MNLNQLKLLAGIPLAPLLMKQGKQVRKQALRLPEPDGKRDGKEGEGELLRLLILGDSAAAGVGVEHQTEALSGRLVAELSKHYQVHWQLWAQTGHTTADALVNLSLREPQLFDVVVVSLGVNDVTGNTGAGSFVRQQKALVRRLQHDFGAKLVLLNEVPPMDQFPALPQPLRWYMGVRAKLLNQLLQQVAAKQDHCEILRVSYNQQGKSAEDFMARDGFHPGFEGYKLWGDTTAQAILKQKLD